MSLSDEPRPIQAPDLDIHNYTIEYLYPSRARKVAADAPRKPVVQMKYMNETCVTANVSTTDVSLDAMVAIFALLFVTVILCQT